jgi:hypothetical protein
MALSVGVNQTPTSFSREILTGSIPNSKQFRVSGYNGDVGTGREDIWEAGGFYPFPTVALQMKIVSSSANDTAAGTGARTALLVYLDASYNTQTETITLNGTTPVNTVATNILRVQDLHVTTVGSTGSNVGSLTLTNTAGSTTYSLMGPEINRARTAIYTVPAGYRAFITSWRTGGVVDAHNNAFAWMRNTLRATADWDLNLLPGVFMHKSQALLTDMTTNNAFGVPLAFPSMTDIKVTTVASHSGCLATGGFEGWIELAE